LQAHHLLLGARISAARGYDQLAAAVAVIAPGWPAPHGVLVAMLEPDGTLRLVGTYGDTQLERSQWLRMPPQLDVPMTRAVRRRTPFILESADAIRAEFPDLAERSPAIGAVAALPLVREGQIVGAMSIRWPMALRLTDQARRYLVALVEPVTRRLCDLADTGTGRDGPAELDVTRAGGGAQRRAVTPMAELWLPIPLDAMYNPALVMAPVTGDGEVTDFRVVRTNDHARRRLEDGAGDQETTLLTLFPASGIENLLPLCVRVLRAGGLHRLDNVRLDPADLPARESSAVDMRVTRVGDLILLTWRPRTDAELNHQQLLHAERVTKIGSMYWDREGGDIRLSPQLCELLDVSPGQQIVLEDLPRHVHADDLPAAGRLAHGILVERSRVSLDFRGTDKRAGRFFRVTAQPVDDGSAGESPGGVLCTVQDVTEERLLQERLRETERALAEQRTIAEREAAAAAALTGALMPPASSFPARSGATMWIGCSDPAPGGDVDGTWYDVRDLPGGGLLLAAGGVEGSGLDAVLAAGRIRHGVRAYAMTGDDPAATLAAVNRLTLAEPQRGVGTVLVATYRAGTLDWAAAGQLTPVILNAEGGRRVVAEPVGLPVGLAEDARYPRNSLSVRSGDRVVLCTGPVDAVPSRPATDPADLPHAMASLAGSVGRRVCALVIEALPVDSQPA
jgi:PAS domain-containing protein